jgi:prevent-host-death family protein
MGKLPIIVPVSDLRQDASKILDIVRTEQGPLVITQRGRAAAVLMSLAEYEAVERRIQLLDLLDQGEKEIAQGMGDSAEAVMSAARVLLGS